MAIRKDRVVSYLFAASLSAGSACTSSEGPTPTASATNAGAGYDATLGRNGRAISEHDACARLFVAEQQRVSSQGCVLSVPACPDFLRVALPKEARASESCDSWDEGTIAACEKHIATLDCTGLVGNPCLLTYFASTSTGLAADGTCGAKGQGGAGGNPGASGAAGASDHGGASGGVGGGASTGGHAGAAGGSSAGGHAGASGHAGVSGAGGA